MDLVQVGICQEENFVQHRSSLLEFPARNSISDYKLPNYRLCFDVLLPYLNNLKMTIGHTHTRTHHTHTSLPLQQLPWQPTIHQKKELHRWFFLLLDYFASHDPLISCCNERLSGQRPN